MFHEKPAPSSAPVTCIPNAIPAEQREAWVELAQRVYGAVREVHEITDGYAFLLPGDAPSIHDAAHYVTLDRQCCAYLRWTLRVEPEQGDLWMVLTGSTSAKHALRKGFETTDLLRIEVARAAGFEVEERRPVVALAIERVASEVNAAGARES